MARETLDFDVVVVGAGPAGLACACRLAQLARAANREVSICVLEKGAEIGAHIVSGAVLDPRALDELFPDWRSAGLCTVPVAGEELLWLPSERRAVRVPQALVPRSLRSAGHYVASLGEVCRWLGAQAEALGCTVLPGFAAVDTLYDGDRVAGVVTGDMGVARDGTPLPNHQPGYALRARFTVLAEGARGHLGRRLEARHALRGDADPQHYALGFKEVWQVGAARHRPGHVLHTFGWPLAASADGGGFVYHADGGRLFVGFVVGLGYTNPYLDPFEEFQRFKRHAAIRPLLEAGERLEYGARALAKGGPQSLPRLTVPGAVLVGCDAGFLNPARLKGSHTAMKSGMLAAETLHAALALQGDAADRELQRFDERVRASWLQTELRRARNFAPAVARLGPLVGGALALLEQNVLGGRAPFTLRNRVPDRARLRPAARSRRIDYAPPDGRVAFDRASSVFSSRIAYRENQPVHLLLGDPGVPVNVTLPRYDEPAQRYCPAGVYEIVRGADGAPRFEIHAANCVHCKTCDIKDPARNITWVPPEGGSGPRYSGM